MAIGLVLAAASYTALLCIFNAHVMRISNTLVAVVDGAIVLSALALALPGSRRVVTIAVLALAVNFLALVLLSQNFDLKAVRDPLLLVAFASLGWRYGGLDKARGAFVTVSFLVVLFALFEYLAPRAYEALFNVISYYEARGVVGEEVTQRLDNSFFVSGFRGDGRNLLPILGPHRVSSIFVEPVSLGNFGALAIAFAFSLAKAQRRLALAALLIGAFCIIMADARFASGVIIFFVVARFLPVRWSEPTLALMPLAAISLLLVLANSNIGAGDDLPTRLAGAGRTLMSMNLPAVFGLDPTYVNTADSGYAYVLATFGLPFCVLTWLGFVAIPARNPQAARFKLLLGVYVCALLCVSGSSLFALKTAGLAWFMFGAMASEHRVAAARSVPSLAAQGAIA
ncbi:hypothetical protein [Terricaulis sp.]|uniref:hypothetical protein n=1 Tax=Terricaulis sp. TaxID=2768686 RepID=UPI003783603D